MKQIEAVFQGGVFKPLSPVQLAENQRVRLQVQESDTKAWEEWLRDVQELRNNLFAKYGYFPDSTLDIAEDRRR